MGGREGGGSYMERMKGKETDKEKEKEKSRERRKDREREREKERERNEDERKVSNNRLSTVFSQMLPQRPYRPSPVITEGLRNSPLAATLVRSISVLTLSINFYIISLLRTVTAIAKFIQKKFTVSSTEECHLFLYIYLYTLFFVFFERSL